MKDVTSTLDLIVAQIDPHGNRLRYYGRAGGCAYAIPRATEDIDFTLALDGERLGSFYAPSSVTTSKCLSPTTRVGWTKSMGSS